MWTMYLALGVILVLLGLLIWKKEMVSIIAGYEASKTKDKKGLAKWVGKSLVISGIAQVAIGIISSINHNNDELEVILMGLSLLTIIIVCVVTALGCKKYEI